MKNLLKILSLLCLLARVLFVSACGDENTPPSQSSTDNSTPTSGSAASSGVNSSTDSSQIVDDEPDVPVMKDYTVKAVDAFGNELGVSVIVEMFKDGASLGEKPMRKGSAVFNLEEGDYTFTVSPMEGKFYYDEGACTLSADETEKTVTLYTYADGSERQTIHVYDSDILEHVPYEAVHLFEGGVYVEIDRPEMSYFIFTPTRGGIYEISCESSEEVFIGNFGGNIHYINGEAVSTSFELTVRDDSVNIGNPGGTTQCIIGVRSEDARGCVVKIQRIGDAEKDMEHTVVQIDKSAIKVDNYVNSEFVLFDITDPTQKAVYNEKDGYYHLNSEDGPLIYIRLTPETDDEEAYETLPSLISIHETGGNNFLQFIKDEDGNLIRIDYYNEMIVAYGALCGTKGLYPLNEQLATAVKAVGEQNGWFDDAKEFAFGDNASNIFMENAWLLYCVYENPKALGTEEKPAPVAVNSADSVKNYVISAGAGEEVVLRTVAKATLTIKNAQDVKVIANDGTEYVADSETGVLSCVISANQNFKIVYEGEENETTIVFTFIEYFG